MVKKRKPAKQLIGICGINCGKCDAYLAYTTDNEVLRKEAAVKWAKEFNHPGLTSKDMNCAGCNSENGPWFSNCAECAIRLCGKEKKVDNCGKCSEYSCEKLSKFHSNVPDAKTTCEKIHQEK
jgi:hypothetical protein